MTANWWALLYAIVSHDEITIDRALKVMGGKLPQERKRRMKTW